MLCRWASCISECNNLVYQPVLYLVIIIIIIIIIIIAVFIKEAHT